MTVWFQYFTLNFELKAPYLVPYYSMNIFSCHWRSTLYLDSNPQEIGGQTTLMALHDPWLGDGWHRWDKGCNPYSKQAQFCWGTNMFLIKNTLKMPYTNYLFLGWVLSINPLRFWTLWVIVCITESGSGFSCWLPLMGEVAFWCCSDSLRISASLK